MPHSSAETFGACVTAAQSAEAAGNLDLAVVAIEKALAIAPEIESLYNWLGWVHRSRGASDEAMAAAMRVSPDNKDDFTGSLRLRIYLTLDAGDWQSATALLGKAQAVDFTFADACRVEIAEHILSLITAPAACNKRLAPSSLARQLPTLLSGADAETYGKVTREIAALAISDLDYDTCREILNLSAAGVNNRLDDHRPLGDTVIVTSLSPTRIDLQRRTISSWNDYGAHVWSFNCNEEIRALADEFPDVTFVSVTRTANALFKKPYVYVDDMLRGAVDAGKTTIGILNADVMLGREQHDRVIGAVRRSRHAVVFGHRLDVDDLAQFEASGNHQPYTNGYDWFLVDRAMVDRLAAPDLVFGCPWWDLWMPVAAVAAGMSIVTDHALSVYHEKHDVRWMADAYCRLGDVCLRNLAALDRPFLTSSPALQLLRDIAANADQRIFGTVPPRAKFDWLSRVMRNIIKTESRIIPNSMR